MPDTGPMDRNKLKDHLAHGKLKPVSCAIGVNKSGAVLLLDKVKSPKSLMGDLEKKVSGLATPNWGVLTIDKKDHKLVVFQLEKRSQGLAVKLKRALKDTGFTKVEIRDSTGMLAEAVGEQEDAAEGAEAPAPVESAPAESAPVESAPVESAPVESAPVDSGPVGSALPDMAPFDKAKVTWTDTRQAVEAEVGKLHAAMTEHYKGHGFGSHLDQVFRSKVEPMMHRLDHSLVVKLDELTRNTDPASHAKLLGEARDIIKGYEDYLAGEPIIAKLDHNPFVPLEIEKTLTAALENLSQAIA